jgi:hypothetical protein
LLYSAVWQRDFDGIVGEFGPFGVIPVLDLLEQRKTFRMESRLAARCQISPFWCSWYKTLGLNRHICTPHTPSEHTSESFLFKPYDSSIDFSIRPLEKEQ